MKIKRFFSQDMRSAIRMVREELGADAVILSNDRVNGGVEIVAAVDYDEAILNPPPAPSNKQTKQLENAGAQAGQRTAQGQDANSQKPSLPPPAISAEAHRDAAPDKPSAARQAAERAAMFTHKPNAGKQVQATAVAQPGRGQARPEKRSNDYAYGQAAQNAPFDNPLQYHEDFMDEDEYDDDPGLDVNQHLNSNLQNRIESAFKPTPKSKESPYLRAQNKSNPAAEFYTLDEPLPDEAKINDTLYAVDQSQDFATEPASGKKADYSVWSQEPTLMAMRNEITTLRGMLEQQLTSLAWNDLKKNNPLRAKLFKQLLELGFSPELADRVIHNPQDKNSDYRRAWQLTLSSLAEKLPIKDDDVALSGGVVSLVGATGVGKTTTIAKLAARYALRHGRNNIVLITTDTYRIGALEQLRTYGRILGIPVKIAHNKKQLQEQLKMLADKKFVLIDTAGMGQRDVRLMEQFSIINECAMGLKTLLVLSSTTHRAALDETVKSFSNVEINGCILTKLDETTNLGGVLSVVTEHQLPVAYISDGQRVPEDLHLARAHTLINRCVTIARRVNQPLDNDSLELAYSRMPSHASA